MPLLKSCLSQNVFCVCDITKEFLEDYSPNTVSYNKQKQEVKDHFFKTIRDNGKLSFLGKIDDNGREGFFNLVKNQKDEFKKELIYNVLCNWVTGLVKKPYWSKDLKKLTEKEFAKAQYELTSLRTKEKLI